MKNHSALLALLVLSGSAFAGTHNVRYESSTEGNFGRYYIYYTDPSTGKEQGSSSFGSQTQRYDGVTLKTGQKLKVNRWLYAGNVGKAANTCRIYIDDILVAENRYYPNACTAEYIFIGN
jgi:hypothetical protein